MSMQRNLAKNSAVQELDFCLQKNWNTDLKLAWNIQTWVSIAKVGIKDDDTTVQIANRPASYGMAFKWAAILSLLRPG